MSKSIKIIIGVLVVALLVLMYSNHRNGKPVLGAAGCDGNTCFTSLEVLGASYLDGATTLGGAMNVTGVATLSGGANISGVTSMATSTISGSLKLTTTAPSCIEMYATSTATKVKLIFATGSTTPTTAGFLGYGYGSCTN